ncbi:MAG TPA: protein kinase [Gemmataceae bacterium]|nr:protein kinase [Gemmataceae bacterium]
MRPNECPTEQELSAFHLGDLPEALQATVAAHLEQCTLCETTLQQLEGESDLILSALRLPANGATASGGDEEARTALPRLPGYEMIQEIGRGGMGVVYKAKQVRLGRLVALKMLLGSDRNRLERFHAEAATVAQLQHPHIVQIFDIGEYQGQPYLALELVEGSSLAESLAGRPRPVRESAELLSILARAVGYAHEHGVVHRDLKPANVLLASGGREPPDPSESSGGSRPPLAGAAPKITDFGLARRLEMSDTRTVEGDVLGTPAYMAPEQAAGRTRDVGPAADVYALGAILYEMLTGRPPFQGQTLLETLAQVRSLDPVPPSRLQPGIPRDLETICLKCLHKAPRGRYASAAALAADLDRFLVGAPILARRVGGLERLERWCQRNPGVAALVGVLAAVLIAGFVLVAWKWRDEMHARAAAELATAAALAEKARANEERRKAEQLSASSTLDVAINQGEHGQTDRAMLLLARSLELAEGIADPELERLIRINLGGWRRELVRLRATLPHPDWTWAVAFSPDGKLALTGCKDRAARLWDVGTGQQVGGPLWHEDPVWTVGFSPEGSTILTGSGDPDNRNGTLRLWTTATREPRGPALLRGQAIRTATFGPDGRTVLVTGSKGAHLLSTTGDPPPLALPHPGGVLMSTLAPDGKTVVTVGGDGTARLWRTAALREAPDRAPEPFATLQENVAGEKPTGQYRRILTAEFSPDGRFVATGASVFDMAQKRLLGGEVRVWRADTGEAFSRRLPHRGPIKVLSFNPDGRRLLAGVLIALEKGKFGGESRLWDVGSGRQIGGPLEHGGPVWAVAFSPDGRLLLTGSEDGRVHFWLAANGQSLGEFPTSGNVRAVAFSPDGRTALAGSTYTPSRARLFTVPQGLGDVLAPVHDRPVTALAFSPEGKLLATASADGTARLWDVATRTPLGLVLRHTDAVTAVAFSPDGKQLATGSKDGTARLWETATGRPHGPPLSEGQPIRNVVFSPDGKRLLTVRDLGRGGRLWDTATGVQIGQPLAGEWIDGGVFSADSKLVATGGGDKKGRLHDATTGKVTGPEFQHPGAVEGIAFSPDGRCLATGCADGKMRLWDVATGRRLGSPLLHPQTVQQVAFSSDGKRLLTRSCHATWLWDAVTGQPLGPPLQQSGRVEAAAFSADGKWILTGSRDGTARLWDGGTGRRLGPPLRHPSSLRAVAFQPGGRLFATLCDDGLVRLWDVPTPATGEAREIRRRVELLTGRDLTDMGALHELDADVLERLRRELDGGSRDPFAAAPREESGTWLASGAA